VESWRQKTAAPAAEQTAEETASPAASRRGAAPAECAEDRAEGRADEVLQGKPEQVVEETQHRVFQSSEQIADVAERPRDVLAEPLEGIADRLCRAVEPAHKALGVADRDAQAVVQIDLVAQVVEDCLIDADEFFLGREDLAQLVREIAGGA